LVLGRFKELRGVLRISRLENEFHVDLVGDWISMEVDGGNPTENDGPGEDERGEEGGVRRGLLHVALEEVVNPRMDDGDLDEVSSVGTPYFGVETVRIGR
jgi:hypothetical protein